jgi:hypothetical protein
VYGSVSVIWLFLNAYKVFPNNLRYLGALLIAPAVFVFVFTSVLPMLLRIQSTQELITYTTPALGTDFVDLPNNELVAVHPWIVTTLVTLLTILILLTVRLFLKSRHVDGGLRQGALQRYRDAVSEIHSSIVQYLSLVPLVALSLLQARDSTQSITFTMSGDARNIFLQVMRMRLSNTFPGAGDLVKNGMFGEVLSAGISITNGVVGFPNIQDQYATRSVYLLSLSLMCVSLGVIILHFTSSMTRSFKITWSAIVVALSVFILINPYPLAEILRSGFFSMFVSLGFLISTLALIISQESRRADTAVLLVLGVGLTFVSYQLFAVIVTPIVFLILLWISWNLKSSKLWRVGWLLSITILFLFVITQNQGMYNDFKTRVTDGGAIESTSISFTVWVAIASVVLLAVRNPLRFLAVKSIIISISILVALQLVIFARNGSEDPYGYYGYKLIYAANYVSWFIALALTVAIVSILCSYAFLNRKSFIRKSGLVTASCITLGTLPGVIFFSMNVPVATSQAQTVLQGWSMPSQRVITNTLDLWKDNHLNYIVAGVYSDANDRLANFWSPYFWERNRWEWTYSGYQVDAAGLCQIIGDNSVLLLTSSESLVREMRVQCPSATSRMSIRYLK